MGSLHRVTEGTHPRNDGRRCRFAGSEPSPAFEVDETETQRIRQLDRFVGWSRFISGLGIALLYGGLWWFLSDHAGRMGVIMAAIVLPYSAVWLWGLARPQGAPQWLGWLSLIADVVLLSLAAALLAPRTVWMPAWCMLAVTYAARWGRWAGYFLCIVALTWLVTTSHWEGPRTEDFPWLGEGILLISMITLTYLVDRIMEEDRRLRLRLSALAVRDGLTGLYNHRFFYDVIERELSRAGRENQEVSLLMIDIDHFKALNDARGHLAGDEVLRAVADVLVECVRGHDGVFRYGGEEFTIILPGAGPPEAERVGDRVHAAVRNYAFPHGRITISVGWSTFPTYAANTADLVSQADAALYQAKRSGRDRVLRYRAV